MYLHNDKSEKSCSVTGVTSNLFKRISEHKEKAVPGFTSSTNVTKLVYYEEYATMEEAIAREKQIKGGSRKKKIDLIRLKQSNNYFDVYIHIVRSVTGCHVRYNRHAVEFNGDIFIKVK